MTGYDDYVQNQHIVIEVIVILDHVQVALIENHNMKMRTEEVDHWEQLIDSVVMIDILHDGSTNGQIEMIMNDCHDKLIDYYYCYLLD